MKRGEWYEPLPEDVDLGERNGVKQSWTKARHPKRCQFFDCENFSTWWLLLDGYIVHWPCDEHLAETCAVTGHTNPSEHRP